MTNIKIEYREAIKPLYKNYKKHKISPLTRTNQSKTYPSILPTRISLLITLSLPLFLQAVSQIIKTIATVIKVFNVWGCWVAVGATEVAAATVFFGEADASVTVSRDIGVSIFVGFWLV